MMRNIQQRHENENPAVSQPPVQNYGYKTMKSAIAEMIRKFGLN